MDRREIVCVALVHVARLKETEPAPCRVEAGGVQERGPRAAEIQRVVEVVIQFAPVEMTKSTRPRSIISMTQPPTPAGHRAGDGQANGRVVLGSQHFLAKIWHA